MGAIKGTVIHVQTTKGLEGVSIESRAEGGSSHSATSDEDGSFHLADLPAGKHELTASKDGFDQELYGPLQIFDKTFELRIALRPKQD